MLKSETIGDKELQKQRVRERYSERADPDKMFVIPATEQPINIYEDDQQRRVAVYVRVSTDSVQQTSSYELQKNYYTSFVESHPNWVLVHIYADEGISGTSLNHRDEFNAMIADCERGKIDLIVTKSVSRFARNIVDCISMVRRLRALRPSVGVYFEAEHIFTLKNDTDMSLAFTATMAEEESHTKSTIMNMSVQMRFGLGKYLTPTLLGYKHDENGNLIINEDEAPIVRLIFFMYLYGYTCQQIADHLTMLQVKTRKGKDRWSSGTIVQVLRNERHCGDIRAGKTFTPDFHTHRSVKNRGERPIYGMYDHHEPIISRDDFIAVQQKLNNAKYGNKGILPELRVVKEGVLTGFVSINPRWAGFSEKDYCDASSHAQCPDVNNRKDSFTADAGEFDYRGYEITRSQFFESQKALCSTFSISGITFMVDCIRKLNGTEFVELLIHPDSRRIAVRPSNKENRNAIKWLRLDNQGLRRPKQLQCTACMKTIFGLLGWNVDCRYRMSGTIIKEEKEAMLMFQAKDAEMLLAPQHILTESELDKNLEEGQIVPFTVGSSKRVVAFPDIWTAGFGTDVYVRQRENETLQGGLTPLCIGAAACPVPLSDRPAMTSQEVLEDNINAIIHSIKQGDKAYVE